MGRTFDELSQLIGKYPRKFHCLGGVGDKRIDVAEELLGIRFPSSYREFLRRFGRVNYLSEEFFGLEQHLLDLNQTSCVQYTLWERNSIDFPNSYIVIYNTGWEGEVFCLDTNKISKDNECPIVNWIGGMKQSEQPLEVIADTYIDFIVNYIERAVERYEQRANQKND